MRNQSFQGEKKGVHLLIHDNWATLSTEEDWVKAPERLLVDLEGIYLLIQNYSGTIHLENGQCADVQDRNWLLHAGSLILSVKSILFLMIYITRWAGKPSIVYAPKVAQNPQIYLKGLDNLYKIQTLLSLDPLEHFHTKNTIPLNISVL